MDTSKKLWVIGFPKSGNTWVCYLTSYIYNVPYFDFADLNSKPKQEWVYENTRGQHEWDRIHGIDVLYKSHKMIEDLPVNTETDLILYVHRDPRDVYISFKHFMENGLAEWKGRLQYRFFGFWGEKSRIKWFINQWENHLKEWAEIADLNVSYDSLLEGGADYLYPILKKEKEDLDKEIVESAIEKFSFKSMTKGRKRGSEDKDSFFRKGVSGDWENHLSKEESDLFNPVLKG